MPGFCTFGDKKNGALVKMANHNHNHHIEEGYDVVVVGSGPAGSMAAKFAAAGGASVLAVDRRNEIGSPVRCAEGVPLTAEKLESGFGVRFSQNFVSQEIKGSAIISPSGNKREFKTGHVTGFVAERKVFDRHLAMAASAAGAKIITSTNVVGLAKGKKGNIEGVVLERFGERLNVSAKLVIAADGICSKVGRMAGFDTALDPHDVDSCLQYEMHGVDIDDPELFEVYFGNRLAPRGYVWIFPKGADRANIGIGIAADSQTNAAHYLDAFVRSRKDLQEASIVQTQAGLISVGLPLEDMTKDGIMVAGTAARHVDPITGGGILMAMQAGRAAGTVAADAVAESDFSKGFLNSYNGAPDIKNINASIARNYKIRIAMEHMTDEDFDSLIAALPDSFAEINAVGILKLVSKNPKLLKFAKYLL